MDVERYILNEDSGELILIKDDDKVPQWNSKLTNLLIELRLDVNDKFKCSKSRKFELWDQIAEQIRNSSEDAQWITGTVCDNKWRNLLTTFRKIKLSNKKRCYWEYYEQLDAAFRSKIISEDILKVKTNKLNINRKFEKLQNKGPEPPEWFMTAIEEQRNDEERADNNLKQKLDCLEELERQKVKAVEELNSLLKQYIEKKT